jgi:hypothetical protein
MILADTWKAWPSSVDDVVDTSPAATFSASAGVVSRRLCSSAVGVSEPTSGAIVDVVDNCIGV